MKKIFTLGCILAAIVLGAMAPQTAKAAEASFIIYPQNSDYAEIWTTSYYNLIPVVGRACEVEFVIKSENVTADATISITSSDPQDVISLDKTTLLKDDMLGEGAIVKVTMTIDKPGTEYWGVKTDPLVVTLTSGKDTFANTEEITLYPVVAYANIAALRANAANFVEMATIWLENEVVIVNI